MCRKPPRCRPLDCRTERERPRSSGRTQPWGGGPRNGRGGPSGSRGQRMSRREQTLLGLTPSDTRGGSSYESTGAGPSSSGRGGRTAAPSRPHCTSALFQDRQPTPPRDDPEPPMPPLRRQRHGPQRQGPSTGGSGPSGSTPRMSPPSTLYMVQFVPAIPALLN